MNSASIFSDADVLEPEILAKADFTISNCPQCGSSIAAIRNGGIIECGICDFADATTTLADALILGSIRLFKSVDRVEIVLNHF
jgi:hypothetical protein